MTAKTITLPLRLHPLMERWVEALRSGEYEQQRDGYMFDGKRFNVLGVLCDVYYGRKGWSRRPKGRVWTVRGQTRRLPESLRNLLHISDGMVERLGDWNDEGKSFAWLADKITRTYGSP